MKHLLGLCDTWLADGTFKLSPQVFYQIYSIHVELWGFALPYIVIALIGLLPNKTEKTYERMVTMLCECCQFAPSKILIDFEKTR